MVPLESVYHYCSKSWKDGNYPIHVTSSTVALNTDVRFPSLPEGDFEAHIKWGNVQTNLCCSCDMFMGVIPIDSPDSGDHNDISIMCIPSLCDSAGVFCSDYPYRVRL